MNTRLHIVIWMLGFALLASACGDNVTESSEYLDLAGERDEIASELADAKGVLSAIRSDLDSTQADLETAQSSVAETKASLSAAEEALAAAQSSKAGLATALAAAESEIERRAAELAASQRGALPGGGAATPDGVLADISLRGYYVQPGARAIDESGLSSLVTTAAAEGTQLMIVILDEDPAEGAIDFADAVLDGVGEGTVIVLTRSGFVGVSSTEFSEAQLDAALDAADARGGSDLNYLSSFAESISQEMDNKVADLGGRTVTVGVENAYLPFNYILPGESEGQGWDYDAWREICRLLNCEAEFVEVGWPMILDQVANGHLDAGADGISITDERKQRMAFSNAYMAVEQKFMIKLDDDRYATADDVINSDALVGTQVGNTNFELAEELVGTRRVKGFNQLGLAVQALTGGDVDAVIIDDTAGLGYLGEDADQVKLVDGALRTDPLGFIFPLDSDLVAPVNAALAEMASSGFLDRLARSYFTESFTVTYDDLEG